jgi:hypothetical protein
MYYKGGKSVRSGMSSSGTVSVTIPLTIESHFIDL